MVAQPLTNLFVLPSATAITISWTGTGVFTGYLSGPGISPMTAPAVVAGTSQSVTFTGLLACASYSWWLSFDGGSVAQGQVNTRYASFELCPATETIYADEEELFHGYDHQEDGAAYCGDWNIEWQNWPVGYGWNEREAMNGPYEMVSFGFSHWSDPGSGLFACPESTVQLNRSQLLYDFSDSQWNRGVANAPLTASVTTQGGSCASNGLPTTVMTELDVQSWAASGELWQGSLWASVMNGPETNTGLALQAGAHAYPLQVSGSNLTVDIGVPLGQRIYAGFAAPNDGFGDMLNGAVPSFAADNNECEATISKAALAVKYAPMPPESPVNCTASIFCGGATVTCNASPDTFELLASDATTTNRVVGTVNAANGVSFTDPLGSTAETYQVCSLGANGATACSPVVTTSDTLCPPIPVSVGLANAGALWTSQNGTGQVTLNHAALAGGAIVSLSSSIATDGSVTALVPASVTIPAGATSATFPIYLEIIYAATPPETIELTATVDGTTVTSYVPLYSGNVAATITYLPDSTSLMEDQGQGYVTIYTRTGGGTASLSASNASALLQSTSVAIPASGTGVAYIAGEQVSAATDVVTVSYEGSTAQVTVQVGEAQGSTGPSHGGGGGCKGTTCQ